MKKLTFSLLFFLLATSFAGWVEFGGEGTYFPFYMSNSGSSAASFSNLGPIDATGEKMAFMGPVWTPDRGPKTIEAVSYRWGTVTKTGGSQLTISLQDWSTVNTTPPYRPDEVQDQSVTVSSLSATVVSNAWHTSTFSTTRPVNYGDQLAIVWEFDGAGRLGSDSFNIFGVTDENNTTENNFGGVLLTTGWALSIVNPNIVLHFTDGTRGILMGGVVAKTLSGINVSSSTTPNEAALRFTVPGPVRIDALRYVVQPNSADTVVTALLYDGGNTVLSSATYSGRQMVSAAGGAYRKLIHPVRPSVILEPGQIYRMSLKGGTTSTIAIPFVDQDVIENMAVLPGGSNIYTSTRTDAGSWGENQIRRYPHWGYRIQAISDGNSNTLIDTTCIDCVIQ